jgi:hypothetical protein
MPTLVIRVGIGMLLVVHRVAHYNITTAWGSRSSAGSPLLRLLGLSSQAIQSLGTTL